MKVIEYCAGICLLLFLTEVTLAKHKKDVIGCGHVFNQSVGSIVNNTLHPNTTCTYIIKPSASKLTGTHLFLKKLLLDGNDNVTISKLNTTEPLFPIFHGQNDAVVLITDATSVQITIQTSSVSNIVRHFDAAYDMISETFSFVVDDSISTIQRPLTYDQSWVEVTFVFNARPNVARSFSFELFNLTSSSYVKVTGVENPVSTFSGANRPPDLFSNDQVKIDYKTYPEDKFLLRQFLLDSACSGYLNVSSTAIQLESPIRPVIDNGSMNLECRWFIQSDKPNIEFTIKSIELKSVYDILVITDGPHYDSEPLHQITSSTASQTVGKEIVTNSTTMVVSFKPDSVLSKFTASIRASSGSQNSLPLDVELTAPSSSENLIEKKSKGAITCGHTFNKTTGGVTNNILNHSISCSYHFTPENGSQPIRLLLKKLILDHDDNVTIFKDNDTKPLFPVLHGQSDAVLLITDSRNITITIDTSNVANTTRHFEAAYDGGAEECTFTVEDDISTIQQPILLGNTSEKCKLSYISHPNIERSFTFEIFNLSAGSTIAVEKVENPNTLKGQKKPPDMFSSDAATFDIDFTPGDHFRLRQYELNRACSKYMKVSGSDTIKTAPMPKYDNGSLNLECRWLIVSGNDNSLEFKLKTINLTNPYDVLSILDGPNFDSPPLHEITSLTAESAKNNVMLTSGQNMMVSFKSSSILSNFEAEVRNADQSKYYKNNGTLSLKSSNTENIWLLEVEPSETVTLIFSSSGFPSPAVLEIYDDFNIKAKQIASLSGNVWYPILSTTSRMMIIAKNFEKGSFTAAFSGSTVGCMRMSQGTSGTYTLSKNCNSTCAWIIPPINATDTDLILDLQFISLDTGDMIEVLQMDDKKTKLATISSGITHIPQLTIKSDVGVYLNITRGSCPKKPTDIVLVAQANYLPKCSGNLTLTPGQEVQLTSPGFPNTYPLLADCKWAISTSPAHQFIHVVFNELQLAENHCVILRENTSAPIKLSGNMLPDDLFATADVYMEFNSVGCDPKIQQKSLSSAQGFSVNATSPDYGQLLTGNSGNFTTIANKTLGIWKIFVPQNSSTEEDGVNIIVFSLKTKDKTGNYKLDIYDGATTRDGPMKNNSFDVEMWSRTNSLIIVYKIEDISKPAAEITISYAIKSCNKSMKCENGICMHPDWKCDGTNDCGDYSDEKNCESVPVMPTSGPTTTPTSAPSTSGVSPTAFGVTIIFMLALGAVLAIVTPMVYRKVRNGQYSQFRDVSVIE